MKLALLPWAYATAAHSAASTISAVDSLVDWTGRVVTNNDDGTVDFDWIGVSARVNVVNASYVRVSLSTPQSRGSRFKSYVEDQGYLFYPQTEFFAESDPSMGIHTLYATNSPVQSSVAITLENVVGPQYNTGVTTVSSFITDGVFTELPPAKQFGGNDNRVIEFVGDSITAGTNIVHGDMELFCADAGVQSDGSQSYYSRLCHKLNAACSVIAVGGKCMMKECADVQKGDL